MKNKNRRYIVINLISTLAVIGINGLANALPINGLQTGEVSRQYETLFTPTGFTFSIWGVIYIGLIAFCIYSFKYWSIAKSSVISKVGFKILISNLLNISWILAWHYLQIGVSVFIMLALLSTLTIINLTIQKFSHKTNGNLGYSWLIKLPYNIYLGWIIVATVANISVFLTYLNWNGLGILSEFWLALVLVTGTIITLFLILKYRFLGTGLAVIWGLYGVVSNLKIKNADTLVIYLTFGLILLLILFTLVKKIKPSFG